MKTILRHSVIILILSCLITVFVNRIMGMWIFKIAFPEQSALQSFEFEDFAFSTRQTNENRDENIVLVNIGQLDRSGIAEQISILSKFSPKAIAVNVHFNCGEYTDIHNCPQLLDSLANRQLQEAIVSAGNVILASKLVFKKSKEQNSNWRESLELADPNFS
ncbi:MAG: hypothetical protein HC811_14040, partial [Flammeovirgaceae bacterium]|nr:hypothetical protein [Flammeovirgaceae bacterium]